jgi:protein-disulfide isomerase
MFVRRAERANLKIAALAVFLASGGAFAQSAPQSTVTYPPQSKDAFEQAVRRYLLDNPKIVIDAIEAYQAQQERDQLAAAEKAIKDRAAQLYNDKDSPVSGNPAGDVTIVEFLDYNCGFCKSVQSAVDAVMKSDGKIRLVNKELPVVGGESSVLAARAALAAARQGKYDALHDRLMQAKTRVDMAAIEREAAAAGLDLARLKRDMDDAAIKRQIEDNLELSRAVGVTGTPAFIIGGKLVPGAVSEATLKKLVADARLAQKQAKTP